MDRVQDQTRRMSYSEATDLDDVEDTPQVRAGRPPEGIESNRDMQSNRNSLRLRSSPRRLSDFSPALFAEVQR